MNKSNWIETKKECEIGENGELITKKVTLEREKKGLEKKDIIDISLRLVSLFAIFIPIVLFFQQQKAERDKQKALFQLDVYAEVTTKLHSMVNLSINSKEFEKTKNDLVYNTYPKLKLLNDRVVTDSFAKLKDIINFTAGLSTVSNAADSLKNCFTILIDVAGAGSNITAVANKEVEQFGWFDKLASGESKIRDWNFETEQVRSFCRPYQQTAVAHIKELRRLADKIIYPPVTAPGKKEDEFQQSDEQSKNFDDYNYSKSLFDDFNNKYDSTFKSYVQKHTIILDSIMTSSSSYFYNR